MLNFLHELTPVNQMDDSSVTLEADGNGCCIQMKPLDRFLQRWRIAKLDLCRSRLARFDIAADGELFRQLPEIGAGQIAGLPQGAPALPNAVLIRGCFLGHCQTCFALM